MDILLAIYGSVFYPPLLCLWYCSGVMKPLVLYLVIFAFYLYATHAGRMAKWMYLISVTFCYIYFCAVSRYSRPSGHDILGKSPRLGFNNKQSGQVTDNNSSIPTRPAYRSRGTHSYLLGNSALFG